MAHTPGIRGLDDDPRLLLLVTQTHVSWEWSVGLCFVFLVYLTSLASPLYWLVVLASPPCFLLEITELPATEEATAVTAVAIFPQPAATIFLKLQQRRG
jgi:hypothetical protein